MPELEKTVLEVLKSGQYICGKHNKALQEEFQDFCNVKRAVALNSGTDALHLALRALDIGAGDEVITTAFTFVATTEAIGIVGAKPVFADIKIDTFNIDASEIEKKITPKTKESLHFHWRGREWYLKSVRGQRPQRFVEVSMIEIEKYVPQAVMIASRHLK